MTQSIFEFYNMNNDLINIIIDKVLLALILLAFGYYFNKLLEKHKGNLSYRQKVMEMRMNCYQDMASKAMLYFIEVREFIKFYNHRMKTPNPSDFKNEINKLNDSYDNLNLSLSMGYVFLSGAMAEKLTEFNKANGILNDGVTNPEIWKEHFGDKKHELFTKNLANLAYAMASEIHKPPHK